MDTTQAIRLVALVEQVTERITFLIMVITKQMIGKCFVAELGVICMHKLPGSSCKWRMSNSMNKRDALREHQCCNQHK